MSNEFECNYKAFSLVLGNCANYSGTGMSSVEGGSKVNSSCRAQTHENHNRELAI